MLGQNAQVGGKRLHRSASFDQPGEECFAYFVPKRKVLFRGEPLISEAALLPSNLHHHYENEQSLIKS